MFPNSSKDIKFLNIEEEKPTKVKTESTFNNINEERDSPESMINFINKKIDFKSKFDEKGSDEFLSSKDKALCDETLNDEIEEDENGSYSNINFMKNFTFNKENNFINDEKNCSINNQKCSFLNHNLFKTNKLCNNYCNLNEIEKNKEKKLGKNLK